VAEAVPKYGGTPCTAVRLVSLFGFGGCKLDVEMIAVSPDRSDGTQLHGKIQSAISLRAWILTALHKGLDA